MIPISLFLLPSLLKRTTTRYYYYYYWYLLLLLYYDDDGGKERERETEKVDGVEGERWEVLRVSAGAAAVEAARPDVDVANKFFSLVLLHFLSLTKKLKKSKEK